MVFVSVPYVGCSIWSDRDSSIVINRGVLPECCEKTGAGR